MLATGANFANSLSFDVQGLEALRSKAAANDPAALKAAAKEFEAMFIQTMLKTMRQTSFTEQGDVFGGSSSLKLYRQLLDQQWAQSIANGKGLGLADLIVQRLKQQAADTTAQDGAAADGTVAKAAPTGDQTNMPVVAGHDVAVPNAAPAQIPSGSADRTNENGSRSAGKEADADQGSDRKTRFVEAMLPYAREAEKESGVPARFVLAQAALESGWGSREIVTEDGMASHNLFGIKAGSSWDGDVVNAVTTEYRQGLPMKVQAKFRAYAGYAEAFVDYANLLKHRFRAAIAAGSNARAFAAGLAKGGYATDPRYAEKLQGAIRSIALVGT